MRFFLIHLFSFLVVAVHSQRIGNFSVSQSGISVSTNFILLAGNPIGGYSLLHSRDSITYLEVVSHNQTIGLTGSDEFFSDVHNSPVPNAYNYYKIQLSTFETSAAKKIWVGSGAPQNLLVYPNPVNPIYTDVRFRIAGFSNIRVQGFVRDINGVERSFIDETTSPDSGSLHVFDLPEGIYSVWLTDGTNVYKGKFIVMH